MATKVVTAHPKYLDMTQAAINSLGEKGGSSRQAILRYILENFDIVANEKVVNSHLKMALRRGVENGDLKQSKGTGASGSFKIGEAAKLKEKVAAKLKVDKAKAEKKSKTEKKTKEKKPAKSEDKTKSTKSSVKKPASKLVKPKPESEDKTPKKKKSVTISKVKSVVKTTPSAASKTKKPVAEKSQKKKAAIKKPKTPKKTPKKVVKK